MTTQIGEWLQAQNLEQYADGFDENHIALEDLPELTDADLKELGVAAMGHRKAILRAAAAADTPSKSTVETGTIKAPAAKPSATSDTPRPPARPVRPNADN